MSNDVYTILYLLYGFTFILMGIYAIKEYQKSYSVFPLVNAIIFLGIFGITHGISEWLTMLRYANVFTEYRVEVFFISRILKAISFLSLIQFGFTLLFKPLWRKLGGLFLVLYFIIFISLFYGIVFIRGMDYLYENPNFLIITLRYMMVLPGTMLSMAVLFYHGLKIKKLDLLWMKYYFFLGIVIMIYGTLDGVFVRKADFFPANVLYNQWFIETLGIPIQVFKIFVGIAMYIGIRLVIRSFTWEKKIKLITLKTEEETLRQKQQLNQMLHDDLIQSLFISGLKIEALKEECEDEITLETIRTAVESLNQNIENVRTFIKDNNLPTVTIEEFNSNINKLLEVVFADNNIKVDLMNLLHKQGLYVINKTVLTQVYYILRELLINIVKHAKATRVKVVIYQEIHYLKLIVKDNGIGFDSKIIKLDENFGIQGLKERVRLLNGVLKIRSNTKKRFIKSKTEAIVLIPIEEHYV